MSGAFHDISFPLSLAIGARGGPERRVDVVSLASGGEVRNAPWASARRRWTVGSAMPNLQDLQALAAFFEARGGRLHSFRFRDFLDYSSAVSGAAVTPLDQDLGFGDGAKFSFALTKAYGTDERRITKPVPGSVQVAVDGAVTPDSIDYSAGTVSFAAPPDVGSRITAGFEFDCEARFDTDRLDISMDAIGAGQIVNIPIAEVVGGRT